MLAVSDRELIGRAAVIKPRRGPGDRHFGGVGACLVTGAGNVYLDIDIDTASGTGFCVDEKGRLFVLPPCGRCRELIRQLDPAKLDTEVVLGDGHRRRVRDLLPEHEWPAPLPEEF